MRRCAAALGVVAALVACGERGYEARGVVREVQTEYGQVIIAHEDIPGLMPAMTMNFDAAPELLEALEPGQRIDFTVVFDGKSYRVSRFEVTGEGEARPVGEALAERAPAPPFELIDQDGEPLSLAQLRGKVLLIDFVFTQCPGPCPILTNTHVTLQRSLSPALREKIRFVSISLDPERDTPEALRTYAEKQGADLSGWSFLTGPPEVVDAVARSYGVGRVRGENGEIEHVVVTFLVDESGRVEKRYLGLAHRAAEIRADLEKRAS